MARRLFNIALMRSRAGFNQQEVADALGIKKSKYGDWERETTAINLKDAIRLADLFECTLDELANHPVPDRPAMTADEQTIVDAYRISDDTQRQVKLATARFEIDLSEKSAQEKKEAV